jgi:F-box-like
MTILSQLRNSEPGLPHPLQGLFGDDRLYHYLNVYPLKGLCEGSLIRSNGRAERVPPIHKLPVELLAEIFRHYLQIVDHSQPSLSLCIRPYSQVTPFRLGQVCYYWRSVTLSMGDLWQSMYIGPPKMEHIPLIRLWLSRAGDYPLSLWLYQSDCPREPELQATSEILSLLVERLHRWKAIVFYFSDTVQQALLDLPHGAAASLEAARIDVRRWDQASADKIWRAIHSSPTIRQPDWVNLYWSGPPDHAPWAQLTHIILDGLLSSDAVLDILLHCQSVVNLTVPRLVSPRTSFQMTPILLPHLRSMCISTETELGTLFQSLLLPNMVSLDITYRRDACNSSSSLHLDDLICRSQCQLRKLTLCDTDISEEDNVLDFLRTPALQSLVELQLFIPVSDKTIRLLSRHAGKEELLPRLEAILLSCCTSDGVLSDMITSRLPTLRTIHVSLRRDKHSYEQDWAMLNNIRRKEYDVKVQVF